MKTNITYIAVLISLLLILPGCAPAEQIIIYITPTPNAISAASQPDSPPERLQTTLNPDLILQTSQIPTSTTSAPSADAPRPTVTFMGPIVGEGYNVPATNTPLPTATPLPTNTQPPSATPLPGATTQVPPTVTLRPSATPMDENVAEPTRAGTPLPDLDTSDLGIQVFSFVKQDEWNNILNQVDEQLQFEWIKVQVAWDFYQPNGPDEVSEDFRRLEIFLEGARQVEDVKVLVSIAKAPDWARSNTQEDGPPDDPQALANFITLLLDRMGNGVDAVEVWNEPNLIREWQGRPKNGAEYMRYFDAGYNAVKAFDPNMPVISAGLAPTGESQFSRDDRVFLREMYNAGLANYDGIGLGVHPYGWGNPPDARCCDLSDERGWDDRPQFFFLDTLEDYREIMLAYGDTATPMWLTEFGWATWEGLPGQPLEPWMGYNSKWDQANYALRAIEIGKSLDYVGPMFLWNLNFAQPATIAQREELIAYSIVLPEGAPRERPLFWMLVDATRPEEDFARYD